MYSGKTGVSGVANVSTAPDANQFDTRKASLAEYFNVVTRYLGPARCSGFSAGAEFAPTEKN
jgi:hypothetical protein